MTEPRVRLDLGVTLPGPGPDGRYSPIKANASVEVDVGPNFDRDLVASIEALGKMSDPVAAKVAEEYTSLSGTGASETFGIFKAALKEWQDRVANNLRRLNEATGISKPAPKKDPAEAELEASLKGAVEADKAERAAAKPRRRAAK